MMKTEKDVKKQVKVILDKHGWFWWMIPANGYGKSGTSDFHALKNGTFIAIETKFGTKKPTPLQIGFCNSIRAEDGFAFIVNDRNLDWLDAFLESFAIAVECEAKKEPLDPEHGARMINALAELQNKLLDT